MVEVVREGYVVPFHTAPLLSQTPITLHWYSPQSVKGRALGSEIQALLQKGAVEPASPSPGYYSRMFIGDQGVQGLETDNRPFYSQPFCCKDPLPDGDYSVGSAFGVSR